MPFYRNPISFVPKVVSIGRRRIAREEEIGIVASRGRKKRQYKKRHKKASKPYTHLCQKGEIAKDQDNQKDNFNV